MRTNRLVSVAAGLVLAATIGTAGYAGTAKTFRPNSQTFNITLDTFCDGMTLTLFSKFFVVGPSTGCYAGAVDEGFTAKRGGISYLDISSNNGGAGYPLTYVFDDPRSANRGWCAYNTTDGGLQNVLNCGTYTIGGNGPRGSKGSADPRQ